VISQGEAWFDEAMLTGEPVPQQKGDGDAIHAGTVVQDGSVLFTASAVGSHTTLSRIIRMVRQAQSSKPEIGQLADKISAVFVPAVVAIALISAAIWYFFGPAPQIVYTLVIATTVLIIACPCALGLATPMSIISGVGRAAEYGVLVRDADALQRASELDTLVFDKTGTLTVGQPQVTSVIATAEVDDNALLALAAAVEQGSSHPLAEAIVREAQRRQLSIPLASGQRALAGSGIEAEVNGSRILICAASKAAPAEHEAQIQQLESAGQTVVLVMRGETLLGILALRDTPRDDAATAISELNALGVKGVILTGDNPRAAAAIAGELGLEFKAGLLPEDKVKAVTELNQHAPLAMVGDGINDAPAMKAAAIGIAMGSGTDVALETADAALTHNHLRGLVQMIELARATHANIRQNIAIALGLKGIFLVTTLLGLTGLWLAVLADTGATVLVTANALRLLRKKL